MMEGFQPVDLVKENSMEAVNRRMIPWGEKLQAVGLDPDEHFRRELTRSEISDESGRVLKVLFRCVVLVSDEALAKIRQ